MLDAILTFLMSLSKWRNLPKTVNICINYHHCYILTVLERLFGLVNLNICFQWLKLDMVQIWLFWVPLSYTFEKLEFFIIKGLKIVIVFVLGPNGLEMEQKEGFTSSICIRAQIPEGVLI